MPNIALAFLLGDNIPLFEKGERSLYGKKGGFI